MGLSARERLKRFYTVFSGDDHVLIPINADPDAIASAMAAKRLLWRKTASVTISNINEIKRPDNLTMIRLIGVALTPWEEIDRTRFNRLIMVDSQPDHHDRFSSLAPDAIIDHHPIGTQCRAAYMDIRPQYGATASILTEYLRAARIKPSTRLATGLYYAIKTDTSDFERQTLIEDIQAFQFVFGLSNITLARRIEHAEMRRDFLPYFQKALHELSIRKNRAFVHLGTVLHPDICVQIADFLMRIEKVDWSVVSGVHQGKLVIIFRNDGIRKNAGAVAKLAFGKWGSAGGHKSMARAEIRLAPLQGAVPIQERTPLSQWIIQQIEKQAARRKR